MMPWRVCISPLACQHITNNKNTAGTAKKPSDINALRQSLLKVEHVEKAYYRFQLRQTVGEEGYAKWAQTMLEKHKSIYRNH